MASEADSVPHVRVVSLKYPDAKNCQASPETEQRLQRKRRSARMPRWELRIVRCFDGSCSKKSFDTSCPREWANRLKFVKEKKKEGGASDSACVSFCICNEVFGKSPLAEVVNVWTGPSLLPPEQKIAEACHVATSSLHVTCTCRSRPRVQQLVLI